MCSILFCVTVTAVSILHCVVLILLICMLSIIITTSLLSHIAVIVSYRYSANETSSLLIGICLKQKPNKAEIQKEHYTELRLRKEPSEEQVSIQSLMQKKFKLHINFIGFVYQQHPLLYKKCYYKLL